MRIDRSFPLRPEDGIGYWQMNPIAYQGKYICLFAGANSQKYWEFYYLASPASGNFPTWKPQLHWKCGQQIDDCFWLQHSIRHLGRWEIDET